MDTIFLLKALYVLFVIVDIIYAFILSISVFRRRSNRMIPVVLICIELCIYHILAGLFYAPSSLSDEALFGIMSVCSFFSTLINISFLVYFSLSNRRVLVFSLIFATISLAYTAYLDFFAPRGVFVTGIVRNRFNSYLLADNLETTLFFVINVISFIFSIVLLAVNLRHDLKDPTKKDRIAIDRIMLSGSIFTGAATLIVNIIAAIFPSNILAWTEPVLFGGVMAAIYIAEVFYYSSDISTIWLLRLSRVLAITSAALFYIYMASIIIDGIFSHNAVNYENIVYTNIIIIILLFAIIPILRFILRKIDERLLGSTLDMDFIRRRIRHSRNKLLSSYANLASTLKTFLKVSFCGFIINDQLYSSPKTFLSSWYIQRIMKKSNGKLTSLKRQLSGYVGAKNVFEVEELRNENGILLGYIIIGRRIDEVANDAEFKKRLNTLIPEVASIISGSF